MGRPRPRPGDPGPAASFVVAGDRKAAPESPAYDYGSQVAKLKNLSVVELRQDYPSKQSRHDHDIESRVASFLTQVFITWQVAGTEFK